MRIDHADRYACTVFADCTIAEARPHDTTEYFQQAHSMGYDDVWTSCVEHEALHTLVGELCGVGHSVVLSGVAHGRLKPAGGLEEESQVMSLQRFVRTGECDDVVQGLFDRVHERLGLYPKQVEWLVKGLLAEVHKEN